MTEPTIQAAGRVVVGVDGSEPSAHAAVYAAEVARRRELPLLVAHVTPWQDAERALPMASSEVRARFDESARLLVDAAAATVRETTGLTDVTAAVVDDYPVDGLLALSSEAALMVIGMRGMGGLPGLLLGSTAGAVVQHAGCPVIALPDRTTAPAGERRSVVAGMAGRPGDGEVIAFAATEAAARGTELTLLHAWRDSAVEAALGAFDGMADWGDVEERKRDLLADVVAGWRTRHRGQEIAIREAVVRERPGAALLAAGDTAELLVVGHRQGRRFGRLGSSTHAVLHRATCPVAVVPLDTRSRGTAG